MMNPQTFLTWNAMEQQEVSLGPIAHLRESQSLKQQALSGRKSLLFHRWHQPERQEPNLQIKARGLHSWEEKQEGQRRGVGQQMAGGWMSGGGVSL